MGEQAVDLRATISVLRRNRRALAAAAALGAAAGACSVIFAPPLYSSASLVLLPPAQDSSGQAITRDVETVIRIASSDAVIGPAGKGLNPPMSARALGKRVHVTAPTADVIQIEANAETPDQAQAMTQAVAKSEVAYVTESASSLTAAQQAALATRKKDLQSSLDAVNQEIDATMARKQKEDPTSTQGKADASALAQLTSQQANLAIQLDQVKSTAAGVKPTAGASIIQGASPAKRPGLMGRLIVGVFLGLLAAVAVAAVFATSFARRDKRVRYRDQIADAVGSPVVASVRTQVPRTVAGWRSLLEDYDPGTVDAWALRQALRQLGSDESVTTPRGSNQPGGRVRHPMSITVVSLAEDLRGLAVGPQLAAYAASAGIRTRLVAAQPHETAAPLWAACTGVEEGTVRPNLLVDPGQGQREQAELTVVLAVVDRREPQLRDLPEASVTILAISPGSATPEDLARTAVTADDAGMRIVGIIVADPDDLDRTTGRLLQHERSQQVALPTRLTGMNTTKTAPSGTARGNAAGSGTVRGKAARPSSSSTRRRPG